MKNIPFIFIILISFLFSCKNAPDISTNKQGNDALIETLRNPTHTLISAHRGGSGLRGYPENSLETLDYLYKQDIQIFEIDIIQSKDDELMLLHDDFLERTTNGQGKIKELLAEDLRQYHLVDDFGNETTFKIPFLEDVFKWTKDKEVFLMLDFKRNVKYEDVIALIRAHGLSNQCILISYSDKQAIKQHKLAPEMQLSVSARNMQELDWMLKTNIPTNKMIAFTGTQLSNESLYNRLKDLEIPVILGTLGNLDKKAAARGDDLYKEWANLGIQIITTDRPLEAYNALK